MWFSQITGFAEDCSYCLRGSHVFFAKGREIISAAFSELTLINSSTLLFERWWKFGVTKTNNKQTSTVSLQMPWSVLLIKRHASSAHCLCHCYSNALFIMLWMWRLCSAGSSTMSTASAPGPHAVCYSSWAVLRICMCSVWFFFTLHSMLHVPSPAKTCENCKKDASAKLLNALIREMQRSLRGLSKGNGPSCPNTARRADWNTGGRIKLCCITRRFMAGAAEAGRGFWLTWWDFCDLKI